MHRRTRLPLLLCAAFGALGAGPAIAQSAPPVPLPEPSRQAPPPVPPGSPGDPAGLQAALRNFPPPIIVNNVRAVTTPGDPLPPACPAAGGRVEQKGGPTLEFLGTVEGQPELCRMKIGGEEVQAWFGIWATTWPGADFASRALQRVRQSKTGDVVGFDTVGEPGVAEWHDLIRQDGIEDIRLLGQTWSTLKLTHYREGFNGNTYRSVASVWIDLKSGLPVFATYQHISGMPDLDGPMIPTAIVPAGTPPK